MTVQVAVLWHMHQPSYRDPLDGTFVLPWVRLHALKDYWGMVAILAETPQVRVTFNLVPSLLDQIEAYVSGEAREAELRLGLFPAGRLDESEKVYLLRAAFMAHPENLIGRFPRFAELLALRGPRHDEASLRVAAPRFGPAEMRDLQVLSKLAWFDLEWQRDDAALRALIAKGRDYTEDDKHVLAEREQALLGAVIPAYRRAADEGRIELSASPYYHPILPLLCDSDVHREAHPGAYVPRRFRHPEDAADQIRRAIERHTQVFGRPPAGMWPSEGSVSEEAVTEMARAGLRWTASDEGVLERSIQRPLHRDSRGTAHPAPISSIGPGSGTRSRGRLRCSSATARSATSSGSATRARIPSTPPTTCSSASAASATPGPARARPAIRWCRSSWTAKTPGSTSARAAGHSCAGSTPACRPIRACARSP
jgi:alpha-amylase/alpha-mannosidase (GH57 family)